MRKKCPSNNAQVIFFYENNSIKTTAKKLFSFLISILLSNKPLNLTRK